MGRGPASADLLEGLILGAGSGDRLGRGAKAFVRLGGRPLLRWVIDALSPFVDSITVAVPPGTENAARDAAGPAVRVVAGGRTRLETLRLLVESAHAPMLLIHDVAHPLTPGALIERVIATAGDGGAACAAIRLHELVRERDAAGGALGPAIRRALWTTQKPVVLPRATITRGIALYREDASGGTGVIELAALAGTSIIAVPGDPANLKITEPADLELAERLAASLR